MDPLTHTLVGASLASTRLGRTTRLATPALVIGANLPDIDVLSFLGGGDAALGFRRGLTHGVPALLVLPALLAAALWLWGRGRAERGVGSERAKVSPRWLTALCYLAVLTHPALDWLNTYGMRWWMPFNDSWAYGDSVFIIDPWLWLVLGGCWLLARRPTRGLGILFALLTGLFLLVVESRAPRYLPVLGVAAALLLAALVLRLPARRRASRLLPIIGLVAATGYIGGMIWLHDTTETRVRAAIADDLHGTAALMVGPMPANPLLWDVLYRDTGGRYRYGAFDWRRGGDLTLSETRLIAADRRRLAAAAGGQIPGFLRWTRFPWIEAAAPAADGTTYVMDARYARRRTTGFGGAAIEPAPLR